jgi:hypothetical protein
MDSLLTSNLPLAILTILAGVFLQQIVPVLRTYLLSRAQTELHADLRQEMAAVITGLMDTMDEYDMVLDGALQLLKTKYPQLDVAELEIKIRASLNEVLTLVQSEDGTRNLNRNGRTLYRR